MKRMIAAAMLLLLLTGCGRPAEPVTTTVPETTTVSTTAPEETAVATTVPVETTVPEEIDPVAAMYQDLVNDYRAILAYRLSSGYDPEKVDSKCLRQLSDTMQQIFAADKDNKNMLDGLISELPMSQYQQHESDFGYILHDLNADGIPELFWVREDHSIAAVFTRKKEKMILLDGFWSRYRGYVSQSNIYSTHGSGGAADNECVLYTLDGGKLKEQFRFGMESAYNSEEGYLLFEAAGTEKLEITEYQFENLHDQFPDKESKYWQERELCSLDREILPEDVDGSTTQKASSKNQRIPFLQKIRRIDQPRRSGPGPDYSWLGNMGEVGTYTILSMVRDQFGDTWGKLKSGGWVNLTRIGEEAQNMPMVTAAQVDEKLLKNGKYQHRVVSTDEYTQQVAICAHKEIRDMEFYAMDISESNVAVELLFTLEKLESGRFALLDISFPGDMTTYGMRFADQDGTIYDYLLMASGYEGFDLWEEAFMVDISE